MPMLHSPHTWLLSDLGVALVRAGVVSSATLLVYDYICTLDQEVELIWSSPFGMASVMFIANRYLPFFDIFLSINLNFNTTISKEQCSVQARAVSWLMFVGISICELTLMLRTYALWRRTRWIFIFLIVLTVILITPAIVITKLEVNSLQFVAFDGCRMTVASNIVFLGFCLLTAYDTVLILLTAVQACKHLRQTRSPWVTKLYTDGLIFYLYLLVLTCSNIVSYRIAPAFGPWLEAPQRVVYSILCNRVLFLIFQGNCASTPGAHPSNAETASGIPVVTLTEVLEMDDMEDVYS